MFKSILVLVTSTVLLAAPTAAAPEADSSQVVRVGDLDMSDISHRAALNARIRNAAEVVCARLYRTDRSAAGECVIEAVRQTRSQRDAVIARSTVFKRHTDSPIG